LLTAIIPATFATSRFSAPSTISTAPRLGYFTDAFQPFAGLARFAHVTFFDFDMILAS
jgi:hypothetical protein